MGKPNYLLVERALNCHKAQSVALIILQQKVQMNKSNTKDHVLNLQLRCFTSSLWWYLCSLLKQSTVIQLQQYKMSILHHNFTFDFKSCLTKIYGNIWCFFIRRWLILQRWRRMERLCVKGWKSRAGGRVKALCGICQGVLVDATVSGAGRPEGGRCSRGVALT